MAAGRGSGDCVRVAGVRASWMGAGLLADLPGAAWLSGSWVLGACGRLDDQLLAGLVDVGCALQ